MEKNNMNETIRKLDIISSIKEEELFALQNKQQDLRENMSNPDAIRENGFYIEEKKREMNLLEEVKEYAIQTEDPNFKSVFKGMLEEFDDSIKEQLESGYSATEAMRNYTTLENISLEINELEEKDKKENDKNDDKDDGSGSAEMDISSSSSEE